MPSFKLSFVAVAIAFVAIPLVKAQSTVPTCTVYTCPTADLAGFAIGTGTDYDNDTNGELFCSYPDPTQTTPPPTPFDYYCQYDDTTGVLTVDADGACPQTAVPNTVACARKRALDRAKFERRMPAAPRTATLAKKGAVIKKSKASRRNTVALTLDEE